ncbi:CubicO group peptidase (beta-lactamase class C family) [Labedella gwakjiensis]|uniref:Class A beta-lactamase-related serine hydrolase n=1 Tax=Labedella gwakjiensis TaxID=390269 RepID=A0A2P8GX72_9MICO|nr:serine hydrolase domain-containing protein [Labedella gwakjiensis]PSL38568.1 CubicO group peptidase (beta-lactamase class C family) [Labedella gwakjiensis]RUQ86925.1 class A beta-lactamase-related serine hydrolase [Labedella gwakjiensis]
MTRAETVRDRIVEQVAEQGFGAHGLHVLTGDEEAGHRWTEDVREDIHSAAKGICVLAAGLAADEGLITLDTTVGSVLPDATFGEGTAEVTLRQLLSMSSGVDLPWSPTLLTDWPDLALEFLSRPSRGRIFQYSNASTYTAMRVLEARVGDVGAYLERKLFAPLGIADTRWDRCPLGFIAAGEGLALRTEELSRIGRLIRDRGRWNGVQLVSPEWIDAMHSDWVISGVNPGYSRYALAGWDGPGAAWRLHGAYGQLLIFAEDAVVTITANDHAGADRIAATVVATLTGSDPDR